MRGLTIGGLFALMAGGAFAQLDPLDPREHEPTPTDPVELAIDAIGLTGGTVQSLTLPTDRPLAWDVVVSHGGQTYTLILNRHSVRSRGINAWQTADDGARSLMALDAPGTYRGIVAEWPGAKVSANLVGDGLRAMILPPAGDTHPPIHLQSLGDARIEAVTPNLHIAYTGEDMAAEDISCSNDGVITDPAGPRGFAPNGVCPYPMGQLVHLIGIETDTEFFNQYGNTAAATAAAEGFVNDTSLIYESTFNVSLKISTLNLYTGSDPYTDLDAGDRLAEFKTEWNASFLGDSWISGMMLTGANLTGSTAGLATSSIVGVVRCQAFALSEARTTRSSAATVGIIAHELGHNYAAVHCGLDPNTGFNDADCGIMCASLGGCPGSIGVFGSRSQTDMSAFLATEPTLGVEPPVSVTRLYVDPTSATDGPGDSWATALHDLQDALAYARGDDAITEIWVAEGTYRVTCAAGSRESSFVPPANVRLLGGFPAGGGTFGSRSPNADHRSILDGDFASTASTADNSLHVVRVLLPNVILDGFTIQNANANSSSFLNDAGGLYAQQPVTIANSTFRDNISNTGSAAIMLFGLQFTVNAFVCVEGPDATTIVNTIFHDNANPNANFVGETVDSRWVDTTFIHCTFADSGGFYLSNRSPVTMTLLNCIARGFAPLDFNFSTNFVANFNNLEALGSMTFTGSNNQDANPQFVNSGSRDYRLSSGSPSIDAGSAAMLPTDAFDLDLDGDTAEPLPLSTIAGLRNAGLAPDQGAFELIPSAALLNTDVDANGLVNSGDVDAIGGTFGTSVGSIRDDVDGDGDVDLTDLAQIVRDLGLSS